MIDYSFPEQDDTENLPLYSKGQTTGFRRQRCDLMNKDEFRKFYREHLAVPVAGFGMAAVLLTVYLMVMTWLAEKVHLMQFSIDRFGR
jgi:hypothetical protein